MSQKNEKVFAPKRATQKRTLETRARLINAAREIIAQSGYEKLRVEEVVLKAGTAKGTFFAHFKDKDALMDLIIGARIDEIMDGLEKKPAPQSVDKLVDLLIPLCQFMCCERYVFDIILRYSGAAAVEEIGAIAMTFGRQFELFIPWLEKAPFRKDISAELLAEGIQAFVVQAMALEFCALHNNTGLKLRLETYLDAWLVPG